MPDPVHMERSSSTLGRLTVCGKPVAWLQVTKDWSKVTCKTCLKWRDKA